MSMYLYLELIIGEDPEQIIQDENQPVVQHPQIQTLDFEKEDITIINLLKIRSAYILRAIVSN